MFEPHPPGLAAMWEHWADEEQREFEREELEQRAAVDEFRDAAHWWLGDRRTGDEHRE